uniref:portal protein n=1 Tax=Eubacterium sp. TaxID=142586 RepID=UPI003FF013AC
MSKYKNPMDEKNNKVLKETEQQADKPINKADSFNQANGLEVHESGKGGERLKVIGVEEIIKARETLQKYKQQKQSLESRVVNNEEWWKIHNWEQIKKKDAVKADRENPNGIETPSSSAWLFNSITNKIADFSDNYPEANIRARTGGDVPEAERLKNVIPMILKRNKFYKTYIEDISEKSKSGTGITYVGWNPKKDGIGDVEIQNINILSIFWQGGITNIQKSRNVFTVELVDTDLLKKQYPSEAENITSDGEVDLKQYLYEDYIDTTDKSLVIDWWYKKDGKLHYCKFVNNVVLFATENEPDEYPNGYYDDGNYPFVFDVMFPMQGTIAGFGFIDVGKQPQEYIDKMDAGILQNVLMNSMPRYFERQDSEINEEEFLDWTQPFVKTNTNLGQDDLREINVKGLDSAVFTQRDSKINEIKETTANRDVSTGGTTSGVTAASAISALIETGSKVSRMAIKGTYDAFENVIYLIIERMRQFYDLPRYVRITGDDGTDDFDTYDNRNLKLQVRQTMTGDTAQYLPEFDIEVAAQKASPYSKAAQNELALQLYSAGFFNPQNTDQALACLNIMDFDHKSDVINQIKKNGTLLDALQQAQMQLQQLQQGNEKLKVMCDLNIDNSNLTGMKGKQQDSSPDVAQASTSGSANMESTKPEGMQSVSNGDKGSLAEQAAQKANESAQPR